MIAFPVMFFFSFSESGPPISLRLGVHDYFGYKIDVLQIPTIRGGLCYKLELPNGMIPVDSDQIFGLMMTNSVQGMDKLKGFKLMIASSNTWQGLVYGKWPYNKAPSIVTGDLASASLVNVNIDLEENVWNYQFGEGDFDLCMKENETNHCKSIFDPLIFQNDTR